MVPDFYNENTGPKMLINVLIDTHEYQGIICSLTASDALGLDNPIRFNNISIDRIWFSSGKLTLKQHMDTTPMAEILKRN